MAVVSSWSDLFPERLETGETLPIVATVNFLISTLVELQCGMPDESGDYVKSSRTY